MHIHSLYITEEEVDNLRHVAIMCGILYDATYSWNFIYVTRLVTFEMTINLFI